MPAWHLVGDLDPNDSNALSAEAAARLAADAQETAEREAADIQYAAAAAAEAAARADADTAITDRIIAEVASRAATSGYTHIQSTPQTTWTITHHLGYNPAGIVVKSDGFMYDEFGVDYTVPGQTLVLFFDIALSGTANLS